VQEACRPVLASARIPRFQWRAGETFTAELWILNDSASPQAPGRMSAHLAMGERRWHLGDWDFPDVPAQRNLRGPEVGLALPGDAGDAFTLELRVDARGPWSSAYRLSLRPAGLPPAGDA
jgi:beta-mannosidase